MKEAIHMSIFTGAGVALVTPMHADGSVNFDKMKDIYIRLLVVEHLYHQEIKMRILKLKKME